MCHFDAAQNCVLRLEQLKLLRRRAGRAPPGPGSCERFKAPELGATHALGARRIVTAVVFGGGATGSPTFGGESFDRLDKIITRPTISTNTPAIIATTTGVILLRPGLTNACVGALSWSEAPPGGAGVPGSGGFEAPGNDAGGVSGLR